MIVVTVCSISLIGAGLPDALVDPGRPRLQRVWPQHILRRDALRNDLLIVGISTSAWNVGRFAREVFSTG
jgi:hypothetical protein